MIAREQERRSEKAEFAKPYQQARAVSKTVIIYSAVAVLIIIGAIVLTVSLKRDDGALTEPDIPKPFLVVNTQTVLSARQNDPTEVTEKINTLKRDRLPVGEVRYIPIKIEQFGLGSRFATAEEFFELAGLSPPQRFIESARGRWNLYLYYGRNDEDVVFVFETNEHAGALAGLLAWEPRLPFDFIRFSSAATSPTSFFFQDKVIKNIDARVVFSQKEGETHPAYAIFANKFVILAGSENALENILKRFIAGPIRA